MAADDTPRKLRGAGTKLKMNTTLIAQRTSISGPGFEVSEREATGLDDAIQIKRPGLPNLGELNLELHWDPAHPTHDLLYDRVTVPKYGDPADDDAFILELNDGDPGDAEADPVVPAVTPTSIAFKGWVKSFSPGGMEPEGTLTGSVVIVLTSIPVITPREEA